TPLRLAFHWPRGFSTTLLLGKSHHPLRVASLSRVPALGPVFRFCRNLPASTAAAGAGEKIGPGLRQLCFHRPTAGFSPALLPAHGRNARCPFSSAHLVRWASGGPG